MVVMCTSVQLSKNELIFKKVTVGTIDYCAGQLTEPGIIAWGHPGIELSSKLSSVAPMVPISHTEGAHCMPSTIQSLSIPSCSAVRLTQGDGGEWREGH